MNETGSFKYRQLLSCKCLRMRKSTRFVTQFYDQKLRAVGLRITQFSILSQIATDKKKTMVSIAQELLMDRTTLTRGLSILLKNGYIEKVKTKDARKKIMKLTDKGKRILDKAIPLWLEAEHQILEESRKMGFSVI